MHKRILAGLVLGIFFLLTASVQAASADTTGRYFIHSENGFIRAVFGVKHDFANGFTAESVYGKEALLNFLSNNWGLSVEGVPQYVIRSSSLFPSLKSLEAIFNGGDTSATQPAPTRQTPQAQVPWGVRALYNNPGLFMPSGGKDVTVAIIDTGADVTHPDLINRVSECLSFSHGNTPWPSCVDNNGHGTALAGIVAADAGSDAQGIYGMAPQTKLAIYQACNSAGHCWADDVASTINYAVARNVDIILLGLSGQKYGLVMDAIQNATLQGVLVVAASADDADGNLEYPAADLTVASVGALDSDDNVLTGTPSTGVELFAPGADIETTAPGGGYAAISGTSAAAAHIAGLAAKIWTGKATSTLDRLNLYAQANALLMPRLPLPPMPAPAQ